MILEAENSSCPGTRTGISTHCFIRQKRWHWPNVWNLHWLRCWITAQLGLSPNPLLDNAWRTQGQWSDEQLERMVKSAVQDEAACKAEDILYRRLRTGFTDQSLAHTLQPEVEDWLKKFWDGGIVTWNWFIANKGVQNFYSMIFYLLTFFLKKLQSKIMPSLLPVLNWHHQLLGKVMQHQVEL